MAKHIPTGPIIAVLLVIAASAWLLSGDGQENAPAEQAVEDKAIDMSPRVQVTILEARPVQQSVKVDGVTQPDRTVSIASEASGKVLQVLKKSGDQVEEGELIARVDPQDLEAQLRTARARQEQSRLEYEGAQRLGDQGLQNRAQIAAARTQYEEAKAQLENLELALANTEIKAPFAGRLENRQIEVGSYVRVGDAIAELYDFSPLLIVGEVPEKKIALLKLGQLAGIELATGETMSGRVSFIGTSAKPSTRTFTVEIQVEDSGIELAEATAVATVALDDKRGHYVSPALLNINDEGKMGLKILDDENRVRFNPVSIVRSDTGGVWVAGLPAQPRLIVVGQGFVNVGDKVDPVFVEQDDNQAAGL